MTSPAPSHWDQKLHQRRSLCSALATWADDPQRLARLHPDFDEVACECREVVPTTLERLLWDELEAREANARRASGRRRIPAPTPRTPAAFYLRRRKLALTTELAALVRQLPDLWRSLMDRRPEHVERFATTVGLVGLALAQANTPEMNPALMKRLRDVAHYVQHVQLDTDITDAWQTAFIKQARRTSPDRALRALGMSVLASLFHALPEPTRAAMGRHFQSSLCASLSAGKPLRELDPPSRDALEAALTTLLASAGRGGEPA